MLENQRKDVSQLAEFCTCGSLVVRGNCTNKKCEHHKRSLADPATFEQINFIESLRSQVGDDSEIDFDTLSKTEASALINKLLERKETGD